jgi:hypothetical protein
MSEDISSGLDQLLCVVSEHPIWSLVDMRFEGGIMPLWKILTDFRGLESRYGVDPVYGLLGFVNDHPNGSSPVENFHVDYNRPV